MANDPSSPTSTQDIVLNLINAIYRDIDTFTNGRNDPNRTVAGHAAVSNLNAVIRMLNELRSGLLPKVQPAPDAPDWVRSNVGPF